MMPAMVERDQRSGDSAFERIESDVNLGYGTADVVTDVDGQCRSAKFSSNQYSSNTTDHTAADMAGNTCSHGYQSKSADSTNEHDDLVTCPKGPTAAYNVSESEGMQGDAENEGSPRTSPTKTKILVSRHS